VERVVNEKVQGQSPIGKQRN